MREVKQKLNKRTGQNTTKSGEALRVPDEAKYVFGIGEKTITMEQGKPDKCKTLEVLKKAVRNPSNFFRIIIMHDQAIKVFYLL